MVQLELYNPLTIQINTKDYQYLIDLKEFFSEHVENYRFHPKYRAGVWDGKISLFKQANRLLPYGLLSEFMRFHQEQYKGVELAVSPEVSALYRGPKISEFNWDLKWRPYDYQEDCIRTFFKYGRGIIRAATAAGKSLILAYITKHLLDNGLINQQLIIVPNINLITQFRSDLIDYGFDANDVGCLYADEKTTDRKVVVSTWQSLKNRLELLPRFESVFVDECHMSKSTVISMILENAKEARFRLGCTGTMPDDRLNQLNIKAYLGPILRDYSAAYLQEHGYIAKCSINVHHIEYDREFSGTYDEVKEAIIQNPKRLKILKDIVSKVSDGTCLLLVGKIESEGKFLEKFFKSFSEFDDREIVFIYGDTTAEVREEWRQKCRDSSNKIILIATYPILQAGTNIENLSNVLLVSPFKSKIRVLQSIGRSLRKHIEKKLGAQIHDFIDDHKQFIKHGNIRLRYYEKEKFPVLEYNH